MKSQAGVTLIESMICVALVAIVLSLSVSGFSYLKESQHQQITRESLVSALASARQAAMHKRQSVYMCASSNGSTCGNDWSKGWITYLDGDNNDKPDTVLIAYSNKSSSNGKIKPDGNTTKLAFQPNGIITGGSNGFQVCSTSLTSENQKITIGLLGQIKKESTNVACS